MKLNEPIKVLIILEIIGRPPEHLKETLEKLIKNIGGEKDVKINSEKIGEAREIKEQKNFYSSFAEIEVEVRDLFTLSLLTFKYMPSHIDIISPENLNMTNNDCNSILNELTRRLHGYDEIAKVLQMQNAQMQQKLQEISSPNNKKQVKKR
jgi:hypothetical protein